MAPILRSGRQISRDIHVGDVALQEQLLFGKPEIEETDVVCEKLNVLATEHAL